RAPCRAPRAANRSRAALPSRAARARARPQGRADRRRRRRNLCRLRPLQGSRRAPVLGAASALALARGAARAALSLAGRDAGAVARLSAGLLPPRARAHGRPAVLAPAALSRRPARRPVPVGGAALVAQGLRPAGRIAREPAAGVRR